MPRANRVSGHGGRNMINRHVRYYKWVELKNPVAAKKGTKSYQVLIAKLNGVAPRV